MVQIQYVANAWWCPKCKSDANMISVQSGEEVVDVVRDEDAGLVLCTGCGMLQVQVWEDSSHCSSVYYWYRPEAITAVDPAEQYKEDIWAELAQYQAEYEAELESEVEG